MWKAEQCSSGVEVDKCRERLKNYCHGCGLDVGSGGRHPDRLHDTENKIRPLAIGVDLLGSQLIGYANNLKWFKDDVLDYVFSSHLLEHMADISGTLKEWLRVLKPGGRIVLYLPLEGHYPSVGEPGANSDHKHNLTPGKLIEIFSKIPIEISIIRVEERIEGDEYSFDFVVKKT